MLHTNKKTIFFEGLITHSLKTIYEYLVIFIKKIARLFSEPNGITHLKREKNNKTESVY